MVHGSGLLNRHDVKVVHGFESHTLRHVKIAYAKNFKTV